MFVTTTSRTEPAAEPQAAGIAEGSAPSAYRSRECLGADDMSRDNARSVPRNRDSDDHLSFSIAGIEARIEELEAALATVAPLAQEHERLVRARAALLGEPLPTGLRELRRVTQGDVASVLEQRPGLRAGQIARVLGAGQPAISAHLYRGKNGPFASRGGRWYLQSSAESR